MSARSWVKAWQEPSGGSGHRPLGLCSPPLQRLPGLQRTGLMLVRFSWRAGKSGQGSRMGPSLGFPEKKLRQAPTPARPGSRGGNAEREQSGRTAGEARSKLIEARRWDRRLPWPISEATHHGRSREAPAPARNDRGSSARVARRAAGGRRRAAGPASPPQGRLSSGTQLLSARRGSGPAMV